MKTTLSKPELVLQLQKQLNEIETLCDAYDSGDKTVIDSIAKIIVKIFHPSEEIKSLLAQLKLNHIHFCCSSESYNAKSLTNFIGLLKLANQPGSGWHYHAKLDRSDFNQVSLENWWSNKKVIVDSEGIAFSRAKIIKALAGLNKIELNTSGWKFNKMEESKNSFDPLPETTRQIAFELLESFREMDLNKESKLHYK